jgi:hypothetical protein
MSDPSEGSTRSSDFSDFWSQTQSQGDDPASSPFAPKRPRLVPGGPPLDLNSSISDMPAFLFGAKRASADLNRERTSIPGLKNIRRSPMGRLRGIAGGVLPILIACLVAGMVTASAAYLGATNGQARLGTASQLQLVAVEQQATSLPPARANEETVMLASRSEARTEPVAPSSRRVDPAYVQLLADQGRQLVAAGDLASARVVLERAARAGDAGAALALGGTFDPAVLRQIRAWGIAADPDKARGWYNKAREFGSLEAARRLDRLATR